MGNDWCKKWRLPFSAKSDAAWSVPSKTHFVLNNPSTPTGPRAWILAVEIPTSAPRPKRYPSAKRDEALWKTHAESTWFLKCSAHSLFSVMITSVCELPNLWIWAIAASRSLTISTQHSRAPYSCLRVLAWGGPNVRH